MVSPDAPAATGAGSRPAAHLATGPAVALAIFVLLPLGARADVFYLLSGGTIEGQLLGIESGQYRIRTVVGQVAVATSAVERVTVAPTPFDEYDQRAADVPDTAAAHTELAAWCDEQELRAERRKHLQRALVLDSDHAAARRALGYVRVGDLWVDGRRVIERHDDETDAPKRAEAERRRLTRAIQAQWYRRARGFKSALESGQPKSVADAQRRVLEIRDPLAIQPLTEVLTTGEATCRSVLVQALAGFREDEATMNLGIVGLFDPLPDIRAAALGELARRQDARIARQYRAALRGGSDGLVLRAATALGHLRDREAVPDLIDALTAQRERWVEVPVRRYLGGWPLVFDGISVSEVGPGVRVLTRPDLTWCQHYAVVDADVVNRPVYREVTIYRTEVLEALKQISAENFGFDREAWARWWTAQPSGS